MLQKTARESGAQSRFPRAWTAIHNHETGRFEVSLGKLEDVVETLRDPWSAGTFLSLFSSRFLRLVGRGWVEFRLDSFLCRLLHRFGSFHGADWSRWLWRCNTWLVWLRTFLSAWNDRHRPACGGCSGWHPFWTALQREPSRLLPAKRVRIGWQIFEQRLKQSTERTILVCLGRSGGASRRLIETGAHGLRAGRSR